MRERVSRGPPHQDRALLLENAARDAVITWLRSRTAPGQTTVTHTNRVALDQDVVDPRLSGAEVDPMPPGKILDDIVDDLDVTGLRTEIGLDSDRASQVSAPNRAAPYADGIIDRALDQIIGHPDMRAVDDDRGTNAMRNSRRIPENVTVDQPR